MSFDVLHAEIHTSLLPPSALITNGVSLSNRGGRQSVHGSLAYGNPTVRVPLKGSIRVTIRVL